MCVCVCVCGVVTHLCEVGGFPNSVHSTEGDNVGLTFDPGLHHVSQNVNSPLGAEDLHQTLLHTGLHQTLDTWGGGGILTDTLGDG